MTDIIRDEKAHVEIYWSEPNKHWVIHKVRSGEIESHSWAETEAEVCDAVRRFLS